MSYPIPDGLAVHSCLLSIFHHFSFFGRPAPSATALAGQSEIMDNANWAKFLKACPNLIGAGITRADIDLVWSKVRDKDARKIGYEQFLAGLSLLAIKKFPAVDPMQAFSLICGRHVFGLVSGNGNIDSVNRVTHALLGNDNGQEGVAEIRGTHEGAVQAGSANKQGSVFDKLTKMESYTGVYKARFDGQSGGINSHNGDVSGQIRDLSTMMRPEMAKSKFMEM